MKPNTVAWFTKSQLPVGVKNRNEVSDYDYIASLDPASRRWLRKFNDEYYQASFKHKDRLHKSKEAELELYKANNKRNVDVYTLSKVTNRLCLISTSGINPTYGYVESSDDYDYAFALDLKRLLVKQGVVL